MIGYLYLVQGLPIGIAFQAFPILLRLPIARALLKDAPLLLLEEATASVDAEAHYEIHKALSQLIKGRTVIMIAHRLHTIQHADQILVLNEGCIVERGTHEQLLQENGLYRELWREQNIELN